MRGKVDKPFLFVSIALIVFGLFIFSSAALGLLAKSSSSYSSVAFSQMVLGFVLGTIALIVFAKVDFKIWRKFAFFIFVFAVLLNIAVLFPKIGLEHGGARRWILLGPVSLQTSEVLKFAFVIYFAAWAAKVKDSIKNFNKGFLPLAILIGICSILLLIQPDTDNLALLIISGMAMFLAAGGKWRYIFYIILIGILGLGVLALTRPYIRERMMTFIHPQADSLGASYQIQQSLIAIGSGGVFGRGFGQSIQKFTYLPEPVGDSIFAVAGEEFGFVGSALLLIIFSLFALRGLKIASSTPNQFGRLLVVGIVIMIIFQAFVNIGAMLGVIPLSGLTLPFVSHGGTSLFITLLEVGIVLSVSRNLA